MRSYIRFWVAIAGWCCVFGLLSVPISAAEYERIDDPDGIFAVWPDSTIDWTRHIRPIGKKEFARFRGPALVKDPNGNLMVHAWKFMPEVPSHAGGGIVESRNRLKSQETALIIVHPWGLEDGQGWKGPQAYNCYGYAFMGLYEDNVLCLAHLKDVVRPFVNAMRDRVGVVGYSLPGRPDAIRGKLYQGYDGKLPSEAEREKGRAELKASLTGLSGKDWPSQIPLSKNLDYDVGDIVIYDGLGYPALRDYLVGKGIKHVLLGGYCTDMCVISTTAGYKNLTKDFNVFLVGNISLAAWPLTTDTPNKYKPRPTRDELVRASQYEGTHPMAITETTWIRFADAKPADQAQ